jgi:ketosteroid isomerase-like protein
MSQENVEIMQRLFEGYRRGDTTIGLKLDVFDPDIEFSFDWGVDHVSVKGIAAMSRAWVDQLRSWEEYRTGEFDELIDDGDHVVAAYKLHARGKRSQVEVEMPVACAYTFRDGKIVRIALTETLQQALEAVGLSE